jgi:hypothetical protein
VSTIDPPYNRPGHFSPAAHAVLARAAQTRRKTTLGCARAPTPGGRLTLCVGLRGRHSEREQEFSLDLRVATLAPEHSGPG